METLWLDLRYGARQLLRSPGFTSIAVLTLALGIGANTAIFSVVNAALLQRLPFDEPDHLVLVFESSRRRNREARVSLPNFRDWRQQSRLFEGMAAFSSPTLNLTGAGPAERLYASGISSDLWPLLRKQPALGRLFLEEEDRLGGSPAVILSDSFWRRRFDANPDVIGQPILLNGTPHTVVGVMGPGVQFPLQAEPVEVWVPLGADPFPQLQQRDGRLLRVIARLKPGVTLAQARAEMDVIAGQLEEKYPETNTGFGAQVIPLHEHLVRGSRFALLMLLSAVGLVLLIACGNVASLTLVRAVKREKEIAIRLALGAPGSRLAQQFLCEALLPALAGGAAGLLSSVWSRDLLLRFVPANLPRVSQIQIDLTVLCFTGAVSVGAGVLLSLAPAAHAHRVRILGALRERMDQTATRVRAQRVLVAVEIALSVVLVVLATQLLWSFSRLSSVDPGFRSENLLIFPLELPPTRYPERVHQSAYYTQILQNLESLPGVVSATAAFPLPLGSPVAFPFSIDSRPSEEPTTAYYRSVTPSYFRTLGIPLQSGRTFSEADGLAAAPVVIINDFIARRFFPGEDPVGKRISIVDRNYHDQVTSREVVGVVGDVKHRGLDADPGPEMYVPHLQAPSPWMAVVVRTSVPPEVLKETIAKRITSFDADIPIRGIRTMDERIALSLGPRRFQSFLVGTFAALALGLSALGIYGVMSYSVSQRTREIGIRIALGAGRRDILGLVACQGGAQLAWGLGGGLLAALMLSWFLRSLFFEVRPHEPSTYAVVSGLFLLVTMLACWVPARRAARIDPKVALRYE